MGSYGQLAHANSAYSMKHPRRWGRSAESSAGWHRFGLGGCDNISKYYVMAAPQLHHMDAIGSNHSDTCRWRPIALRLVASIPVIFLKEVRRLLFSITAILGFVSLFGFLAFVIVLLTQLGAGGAARGLAAASAFCLLASVAALYVF